MQCIFKYRHYDLNDAVFGQAVDTCNTEGLITVKT